MHSKAHYLFIFENEVQQGPFPPGRVQRMLRDGQITEAALVWREGLTEWQPINSVLPKLASLRQKEYLKFLGEPVPRGLTFEEAQQRLDALVADNPAKKLALERSFCAESVKPEAKVCRYCGKDLPELPAAPTGQRPPRPSSESKKCPPNPLGALDMGIYRGDSNRRNDPGDQSQMKRGKPAFIMHRVVACAFVMCSFVASRSPESNRVIQILSAINRRLLPPNSR